MTPERPHIAILGAGPVRVDMAQVAGRNVRVAQRAGDGPPHCVARRRRLVEP